MSVQLLNRAAWAPVAVFVMSFFANRTPYPEQVYFALHFLGGAALALFFSRAFAVPPRALQLALAFALSCTAGLLWEAGEFLIDQIAGTHHQKGLWDTMLDLLLDVAGAATWVVYAAASGGLRQRHR